MPHNPFARNGNAAYTSTSLEWIPNEYVVVLNDDIPFQNVEDMARHLAARHGGKVEVIWRYALRGFLCNASSEAAAAIADEPGVKYVDQDVAGTDPAEVTASVISTTWNGQDLAYLDRLDETTWGARDHTYNMCPTASGIYAYVIDEAVRTDHTAMAGRLALSWDFTSDQSQTYGSPTINDCRSNSLLFHGTAMASLLTGANIGAAQTSVISLKLVACNGSWKGSNYINAINWIPGYTNPYHAQPGVMNHSGFVPAWNSDGTWSKSWQPYTDAVRTTVSWTNMPFFAAAGNQAVDACQFSPQSDGNTPTNTQGEVFVVGGTTMNGTADVRWQDVNPTLGSNYGNCVSAYAPAMAYVATNATSTSYTWATGTSVSSPLVAALAARYIQDQRSKGYGTPGREAIYAFLHNQAVTNVGMGNVSASYDLCTAHTGPPSTDDGVAFVNPPCNGDPDNTVHFLAGNQYALAKIVTWDNGSCP